MGTQISDIVQVTITRDTARVLQAGFGVPLFLSETFRFSGRSFEFVKPSELITAGFATTDEAYKAALAYTGQSVTPETSKIGRKLTDVNAKQLLTFDAAATAGTFTVSLGAETSAAIAYDAAAAAIETAIEGITGITSVTVVGDMPVLTLTVEFDGADAATAFALLTADVASLTSVTTGTFTHIQHGSAVETWTEAINAVIAADDAWYMLNAETRTKSEIKELAAIIETQTEPAKTYIAASNDADVLTNVSTDVASELQALSYDRTAYLWSDDEANYPECAWAGRLLPENPGSVTWKFKTLAGITADTFTTAQLTQLRAKNANFFETVGGNSIITSEAVMVGGEFIDIIRGIDWLVARIGEDVLTVFINSNKVPYTNKGVSLIVAPLRKRLLDAASEDVQLITKDSIVITEPDVADALTADKAARLLKNVNFSATLQGAVHKTEINGELFV